MSGKHRWRKNRKPAPLGWVLPQKLTNKQIKTIKHGIEGLIPESNVKAGLPAFLFGLPVIVED